MLIKFYNIIIKDLFYPWVTQNKLAHGVLCYTVCILVCDPSITLADTNNVTIVSTPILIVGSIFPYISCFLLFGFIGYKGYNKLLETRQILKTSNLETEVLSRHLPESKVITFNDFLTENLQHTQQLLCELIEDECEDIDFINLNLKKFISYRTAKFLETGEIFHIDSCLVYFPSYKDMENLVKVEKLHLKIHSDFLNYIEKSMNQFEDTSNLPVALVSGDSGPPHSIFEQIKDFIFQLFYDMWGYLIKIIEFFFS